ncbi:MAG: sigma-70 family RNA polymerase sigma factor [Bacteroidaceae bacterium]
MDKNQFKYYYDEYAPEIAHFLGLYTRDSALIEDVIQHVFVMLWSKQDNQSIQKIKPYLYSCARNTVINELRKQKTMTDLTDLAQFELQEDEDVCVDNDYFFELLYTAIDILPLKMRSTFKAVKLDHMSYAEVSAMEGISVRTVENQIAESMKKLKASMGHYDSLFLIIFTLI